MSKIRLHGSSSGYMEITPPAAASSTNVTLPNSAGTLLLDDGSAANLTQIPAANIVGVCTAGLTRTGGFGKFASYAIIADQKSQDTDGGTFTAGDWRTRDLNTELADPDSIVSISSNQFTLAAGSYLIEWSCPALRVGRHQSRLYDITGSASIQHGKSAVSDTGSDGDGNDSDGAARITISANNIYEIQHRCSSTYSSTGLGNGADMGAEIYTLVKIHKEF